MLLSSPALGTNFKTYSPFLNMKINQKEYVSDLIYIVLEKQKLFIRQSAWTKRKTLRVNDYEKEEK